ncbi:hypothetical protein Pmani_001697 [Petrolisthes manimaculis]|uniref:Reverse transcriptase domain-containing protein n=1 Tax=Petrolisthes manimaculis TaxID=1843537 RepID=A0AAE1QK31_9EUCA|nr:hypothetical protein Pmani_001697 [Petrolisthes manimaculis]
MVVVAKKSGKPRRTVDFQKLNSCCLRETHHTPAPFDMVSDVPPHSFKTVADAHWGFHQVELDEDSRHLTTFITPWGRYQYCRTPMGHCSATDAYTKRFDDAVTDLPRKHKCVDDTLLYDSSVEGAFWHTYEFLELCAKKGITLKPEKFSFCKREVEFVDFHLGWEEYRPTEDRLAAIRNFTVPSQPTITNIRSWFGFVNQLAPFLAAAPVMTPFRDLLKKPTGSKSNGRAEAAVKSAKRVLRGNIGADGNLDTDKATLALMQYHNKPLRDINKSPAQLATGRQLRDGVPTIAQKLMVNKFWGQTLHQRERQMGQQHEKIIQQRGNVRQRHPLAPGSSVLVQDQQTKTWNRTGTVVENKDNRQYLIRLQGSGRISLRTREHLRPSNVPTTSDRQGDNSQLMDEVPLTPTPQLPPLPRSPGKRKPRPPRWLDDYIV